jgi:hypothetical protein
VFEHRSEPLLSHRQFLARVARSAFAGTLLFTVSLLPGMIGYHSLEHMGWLDAFLNASMLLGGMGPVTTPVTPAGKLFAGCYALYCGLVVIAVAGIVFAPVVHRVLHRFHLEEHER